MMNFLKKYLSRDDFRFVMDSIAEAEKETIGEIRVSLVYRRKWKERNRTVEDLALEDFHRLGMEKTRERTGVLIFVLLSSRELRIVADQGINEKVNSGVWEGIVNAMIEDFKQGNYKNGLVKGVGMVGKVLKEHFPRKAGDTDELSNTIEVRE